MFNFLKKAPSWGALILSVCIFVLLFKMEWGDYETLARSAIDFAKYILKNHPTAIVGFLAASIAVYGVATQRKLSRFKNSVDFQNNYMSNENRVASLVQVCALLKNDDPLKIESLKNLTREEEPLLGHLSDVLNSFERMSIGIRIRVYDEDILYRSYAQTVIDIWRTYESFIRHRQSASPVYFSNFELLALTWQLRRESGTIVVTDRKVICARIDELKEQQRKYDR